MQLNVVFAPKDISFVPSDDAVSQVTEYLEEKLEDQVDSIEAGVASRLSYIDEGDSDMPMIGCPSCNTKISTSGEDDDEEELFEWAQSLREDLMTNQKLKLASHKVKMPCCSERVSVVDLDFGGKAGFARFWITLEGADISASLEKTLMRKVSQILGCEIVKIELLST
jgi:hypothetical protein